MSWRFTENIMRKARAVAVHVVTFVVIMLIGVGLAFAVCWLTR